MTLTVVNFVWYLLWPYQGPLLRTFASQWLDGDAIVASLMRCLHMSATAVQNPGDFEDASAISLGQLLTSSDCMRWEV